MKAHRNLHSSLHRLWLTTRCSKPTEPFRYTPETVFDTFPWPRFEMGRARAPGAADGAPAVGTSVADARREAAANRTPDLPPPLPPDALAKIRSVAEAGREIRRLRAQAVQQIKGGLRALYRTLELPGANPLKDAHAALDAAVLAAYAFDPRKDLLAQLLALNLEVAARIERHEPVTAPGLPSGFPEPAKLVTEDCIRPTGI